MTPMFKKIFVAYDGSDQSKDALALGRLLARSTDATVVAGCVYPSGPIRGSAIAGYDAAVRNDIEKKLVAADGVDEIGAISSSSTARGIYEFVEDEGADLIVLGSTHHGPVGRVLAGSVAERLLHGSPCPVAVAPLGFAGARDPELRVIAIGYDRREESQRALALAADLATSVGATLRVYSGVDAAEMYSTSMLATNLTWDAYAEDMTELAKESLDEALDSLPPELHAKGEVVQGRAATILADKADEGADLLVLGSRGYGPLRGVLLGRVSADLMRTSPCPVLVVPRAAKLPEGERAGSSDLATA